MRNMIRHIGIALAVLLVMVAILALATVGAMKPARKREKKVPTQISTLTISQLAEAKMSASHLINVGVCIPAEKFMLWHVIARIDDAVKQLRIKIDAEINGLSNRNG
jgi:Tfp pilus assembly protein PilV